MRTLEVEAQAGAIAVARSEIAVGTQRGVERFAYPELRRISSMDGLWKEGCSGLQFTDGGLVLLGHDACQSFATPANWAHSLIRLDDRGRQHKVPIGPGNWAMVKGLSGTTAVLYDVSEHQGARAMSTDGAACSWSAPGDFRRIVSVGGDRLLGLAEGELVELSVTRGELDSRYELPSCDGTTWTAAAVSGAEYLLGGFSKGRDEYVLARWHPDSPPQECRTPLSDIFLPSQIETAFSDEEHCGADVFYVASIRVSLQGRIVVALGGDGERLGACQSACAIAEIDPSTLRILESRVVDGFDGASGLLLGEDGCVLVNCCGSVHVLEPPHQPTTAPTPRMSSR